MNSDSTSRYDPRQGAGRKSLAEILSRYKVAESGCWEWQGAKNQYGYGLVNMWIVDRQTTFAPHRLQWMRVNGKPREGMDICHTCDNRLCINPGHLFEGTALDNMRDMIAKGRDVRVRGERHGHTTLTAEQVAAIRIDGRLLREVAADYGVSATTICNIKHGKTWGHLPKVA